MALSFLCLYALCARRICVLLLWNVLLENPPFLLCGGRPMRDLRRRPSRPWCPAWAVLWRASASAPPSRRSASPSSNSFSCPSRAWRPAHFPPGRATVRRLLVPSSWLRAVGVTCARLAFRARPRGGGLCWLRLDFCESDACRHALVMPTTAESARELQVEPSVFLQCRPPRCMLKDTSTSTSAAARMVVVVGAGGITRQKQVAGRDSSRVRCHGEAAVRGSGQMSL